MTSNGPDCPPNNANSKQPRHCHNSPLISKFENLSSDETLDRSCVGKLEVSCNATKKLKIHTYFEDILRTIQVHLNLL